MNNPVGIFYSYYPFEDAVAWENCIRRAAAAGADSIEVSTMRLVRESTSVQDRIRKVANEAGLQLSFTTGLPGGCDTSSDDEAQRRNGIRFIADNIRLVQQMGGHVLGGMFHGHNHLPRAGELAQKEQRLANAAESVREMAKVAEACGVVLADEPVNRFESETINTVDEELAFLDRVDSPWVQAVVDTFHMNIEEDDLPAAIKRAGKRIAHVHLAENNRKLPGRGHMDWGAILQALSDAGYSSFLTMESFTIPYANISDSMCIWRDMRSEGTDEDVKSAVDYVKGIMAGIS